MATAPAEDTAPSSLEYHNSNYSNNSTATITTGNTSDKTCRDTALMEKFKLLLQRELSAATEHSADILSEIREMGSCINDLMEKMDAAETVINLHEPKFSTLRADLQEALNKTEDLEDHNRRINFRVHAFQNT